MQKSSLGKGLSALISDNTLSDSNSGFIPNLSIDRIIPNRYQPRLEMNEEELQALSNSIISHGIIEPLIVTRIDKSDNFELIAGERRLRAAQKAGLKNVPAVIKEASPQQMLELAVVENVQRADLNPLEEGMAFEQLVKEFNMSHNEISEKVGLSRPSVANKIRLLKLPEEIKKSLLKGEIDEGHSRALLGLTSDAVMIQAHKMIIRDNLSVRAVEELVRRLNQGHKAPKRKNQQILDSKTVSLENTLKERFSQKVKLTRSQKGGKIIIPFSSDSELERLYKLLVD